MSTNKINVSVTEELKASVVQKLQELFTILLFLIDLDKGERRRLAKMGSRYVDFVNRCFEIGKSFPRMLPSFATLEDFKNDLDLASYLRSLLREVLAFADKLEDTALLAESEAYQTAREVYNYAKRAAKAGDKEAELIVQELAIHFKKSKSTNSNEP
ncbi:MAG: hypothetical protein GY940_46980, partial [bacterium]|nr:hypothetical protein [bacterium]